MNTKDIPEKVAKRMRSSGGSVEAKRRLRDLYIDGSQINDATGCVQFFFTGKHTMPGTKKDNETGEEVSCIIPVDGFELDPSKDWELVRWLLLKPAPN